MRDGIGVLVVGLVAVIGGFSTCVVADIHQQHERREQCETAAYQLQKAEYTLMHAAQYRSDSFMLWASLSEAELNHNLAMCHIGSHASD